MRKYNEAKYLFTNKTKDNDTFIEAFDKFTRESMASYLANKFGSVYLFGGEPFSEVDLLEKIVYKIRREGTRVRLETNGLYINKHFNDEDKQVKKILLNVDEVIVRVDDATMEYSNYDCTNNFCTTNLQDCYDTFKRLYLKRCKLALKSVISTNNINNYCLGMEFDNLTNLKKVLFEKETRSSTRVSSEDFNKFVEGIKERYPKILFEIEDCENKAYFSGNGYLYIDENRIGYYNESKKEFSLKDNSNVKVAINHQKMKRVLRDIRSKNAIFMDIEAVSTPYKHMKKYTKQREMNALWALVRLDSSMQVIDRKIGFMRNFDERFKIQESFIDYLIKNDIECIVVSGGGLERKFFTECLVTTRRKVKHNEFRKLLKLLDNFVDIQDVIKEGAFWLHENKEQIDLPLRSDNLLDLLTIHFPHITDNNGRTNKKDSWQVSKRLDEILFSGKYNDDETKKLMEEIGDYCFDDVYQDIRVYRFYEMWDKFYARMNSPKKVNKSNKK